MLQHVHIVDSVLLKIITMKTCVTASSKRFHTPRQLAVLKTFTTVCVKEAVIRVEIFSRWCFLRHSILSGPLGCSSWWSFLRPPLQRINITISNLFVNITAGLLTCVKKKSRRSQRKKFFWGGEPPPPQLRRTSLIRDFFKESIIRFLCRTDCLSSQYSPSRWSVLYRSLSQFHGLKIWMSRLYSVFYQNCQSHCLFIVTHCLYSKFHPRWSVRPIVSKCHDKSVQVLSDKHWPASGVDK